MASELAVVGAGVVAGVVVGAGEVGVVEAVAGAAAAVVQKGEVEAAKGVGVGTAPSQKGVAVWGAAPFATAVGITASAWR